MSKTPVVVDILLEEHPSLQGVWIVTPIWSEVDRPQTGGWVVPDHSTACQIIIAIREGRLLTNPEIKTDIYGKTYVSSEEILDSLTSSW